MAWHEGKVRISLLSREWTWEPRRFWPNCRIDINDCWCHLSNIRFDIYQSKPTSAYVNHTCSRHIEDNLELNYVLLLLCDMSYMARSNFDNFSLNLEHVVIQFIYTLVAHKWIELITHNYYLSIYVPQKRLFLWLL